MKKLLNVEISFIVFLTSVLIQFVLWLYAMPSYEHNSAPPLKTLSIVVALLTVLAALWFAKAVVDRGKQLGVLTEQEDVND